MREFVLVNHHFILRDTLFSFKVLRCNFVHRVVVSDYTKYESYYGKGSLIASLIHDTKKAITYYGSKKIHFVKQSIELWRRIVFWHAENSQRAKNFRSMPACTDCAGWHELILFGNALSPFPHFSHSWLIYMTRSWTRCLIHGSHALAKGGLMLLDDPWCQAMGHLIYR